ncbi:MAG: DUF6174 domain-containing protein [Chloroflexota bacterium]
MRKLLLTPKRIILGIVAVAITIFFVWLLFGVAVDLFLPQRFAAARQTWESQRPDHYRLRVRVYGFCPPPCGSELQLTIDGDTVTEAGQRATFLAASDPQNAPFESIAAADFAQYRVADYTMDALFKDAAKTLANVPPIYVAWSADPIYDIDFDSQQGYITHFLISNCGRGLLGPAIGDCNWGYRLMGFEALS